MKANVRVERAAEALDVGHGAGPAADDPSPTGALPQPAEDGRLDTMDVL